MDERRKNLLLYYGGASLHITLLLLFTVLGELFTIFGTLVFLPMIGRQSEFPAQIYGAQWSLYAASIVSPLLYFCFKEHKLPRGFNTIIGLLCSVIILYAAVFGYV